MANVSSSNSQGELVPKLRFPGFEGDWRSIHLGDAVFENLHPIPKPTENYTRLGIYCHAKGTFHEEVPIEKALDVDTMYMVPKDNLIVNITFAWEHAIAVTTENDEGKIVSHRFPTYAFCESEVPQFYKYLILQNRFRYELGVASPGGAGRNRVLNKRAFLEIPICVPSKDEQEKISEFLSALDRRIETQQKLVDALKSYKRGALSSLFPKIGETQPQYRFAGFFGPWKQCKFAEIFDGLQNNTLSRADLNYKSGTVKNVHYGDVLIKFGDYINASEVELPYISEGIELGKFKNSLLRNGDIVIADTAEDEAVGKCTEIQGADGLYLLSGLHTIPCRPKIKCGPKYLGYYINSPSYHNQLFPLMQGIKVTSISKSALQDTDMLIPKSIDEQAKIGEFLSNLDSLISINQRKHDALVITKNALLRQMFI